MSDWPLTFTTDSIINGTVDISKNGTILSSVISQDTKQSTEISIDITFNELSTRGATIYVLRKKNNVEYQGVNDQGLKKLDVGIVKNTTINAMITICGSEISQFKILIKNHDVNYSISTPVLRYQQSEGECLLVE